MRADGLYRAASDEPSDGMGSARTPEEGALTSPQTPCYGFRV